MSTLGFVLIIIGALGLAAAAGFWLCLWWVAKKIGLDKL